MCETYMVGPLSSFHRLGDGRKIEDDVGLCAVLGVSGRRVPTAGSKDTEEGEGGGRGFWMARCHLGTSALRHMLYSSKNEPPATLIAWNELSYVPATDSENETRTRG